MAKHRQTKRRLADEDVATDRLESCAGRIAPALVVAGDNDAQILPGDHDLRRAQDMPRRDEPYVHAVDVRGVAVADELYRAREIRSIAGFHDSERFARRQHRA